MEASQFKSDQYVRFCPGCGDHAICMALQKAMAQIGVPTHQVAVISGIGCSSRMPHYLNTYGFNTIHGRGGAIATGVKTSHPELTVWQMSGDGDCLAIGGNHFIHEIRRNVDLNVCLFNNRIYGLTKGQYSPTSPKGFVSKSSPFGTVERPFVPAQLVLGAGGTFFARTLDVDMPTTVDCFVEAQKHKGCSIVECLVNCVIFNNGTHAWIADREQRAEHSIILKHGEKMIFGKDNDKGIAVEIDLCWRIRNKGWRLACVPDSTVYHLGGGALSYDNPRKAYLNHRNNLLMIYKNKKHPYGVLIARFFLDYAAAFFYLLQGRWGAFKAVFLARRDYHRMRRAYR